jgi:hypothetical protein
MNVIIYLLPEVTQLSRKLSDLKLKNLSHKSPNNTASVGTNRLLRNHHPISSLARGNVSEMSVESNVSSLKCSDNYMSRSQWPRALGCCYCPLGYCDRGFESRSSHGCLSSSFCVMLSCVNRGLVSG